jgi:hypothetical protein
MEFPPELARIIIEFSLPSFMPWKSYREGKELVEPRHWASLRKALKGPNAVEVSAAVEDYVIATRVRKFCEETLVEFQQSVGITPHLQSWCHATQTIRQFCHETQTMEPLPILTEEQKITKRDWSSYVIQSRTKEYNNLRELLFVVYGKEWEDSDDEYD